MAIEEESISASISRLVFISLEDIENANAKISSVRESISALEEELLPPILPIITMSGSLLILKLLSKTKKDPNPPIGLEVFLGKVIAEVIPFALFQGIRVEFGLSRYVEVALDNPADNLQITQPAGRAFDVWF